MIYILLKSFFFTKADPWPQMTGWGLGPSHGRLGSHAHPLGRARHVWLFWFSRIFQKTMSRKMALTWHLSCLKKHVKFFFFFFRFCSRWINDKSVLFEWKRWTTEWSILRSWRILNWPAKYMIFAWETMVWAITSFGAQQRGMRSRIVWFNWMRSIIVWFNWFGFDLQLQYIADNSSNKSFEFNCKPRRRLQISPKKVSAPGALTDRLFSNQLGVGAIQVRLPIPTPKQLDKARIGVDPWRVCAQHVWY